MMAPPTPLKKPTAGGNPADGGQMLSAGGAVSMGDITTLPTSGQAPSIADCVLRALKEFPELTAADLRVYAAWLDLGANASREALIMATGHNQSTVSGSKSRLKLAARAGLYIPMSPCRQMATPPPPTVHVLLPYFKPDTTEEQLTLIEDENAQNLGALDIQPQQRLDNGDWKGDLDALGIDPNQKQRRTATAPAEVREFTPAQILMFKDPGRQIAANLARWRAAADTGAPMVGRNGRVWEPQLIWTKVVELKEPPEPTGEPLTLDMITGPDAEEIPLPPPVEPPPVEAAPDLPAPSEDDPAYALWEGVDYLNCGIRSDVWNDEVRLNGVQPISLLGDVLTLQARDSRNLEMLHRMKGNLERGASVVAGRSIRVMFALDGQELPDPTAPQTPHGAEFAPPPPPPVEPEPPRLVEPLPALPITRLPVDPEADSVVGRLFEALHQQGMTLADCQRYRRGTYGHAYDGQRLVIAAPSFVVSRFSQSRYKGQLNAAAEAVGCQEVKLVNSEEGVMLCQD
jgi:hypothetical protein